MTYFTDDDTHELVDDDGNVIYRACLHDDGAVGFRATHHDGRVEYIMLNPSRGSDDGVPTVFVYIDSGEPALENAVHYYEMFQEGP